MPVLTFLGAAVAEGIAALGIGEIAATTLAADAFGTAALGEVFGSVALDAALVGGIESAAAYGATEAVGGSLFGDALGLNMFDTFGAGALGDSALGATALGESLVAGAAPGFGDAAGLNMFDTFGAQAFGDTAGANTFGNTFGANALGETGYGTLGTNSFAPEAINTSYGSTGVNEGVADAVGRTGLNAPPQNTGYDFFNRPSDPGRYDLFNRTPGTTPGDGFNLSPGRSAIPSVPGTGVQGLYTRTPFILGDPASFINAPEVLAMTKPGYMSAAGFTPADALPSLGSPKSFINASMLRAGANLLKPAPQQQQPVTRQTNIYNPPAIPNATPSAGGLSRTGQGPAMSYQRGLPQLNLAAPGRMIRASDISPSLGQLLGVSPQQGYAKGGDVDKDVDKDTGGDTQAALLQYYKDQMAQRKKDDVQAAFKNLGSLDAGFKPPAAQMIRTGEIGSGASPRRVIPQLAALLRQRGMVLADGGQPDHADRAHPRYDGTPLFRTGGLGNLGGKYVEGKGDGTSDDIAAMLANGEYVFSADVVAALGNGSNKAGAKALDNTVAAIRKRARSAPPDKLPPDAKSPLEYMTPAKGKKHA